MKPLYLFILFLSLAATTSAQDTVYYDFLQKPVDRLNAYYFETKIQTDSGYRFADYWMNGHLKVTGTFGGDDRKTRVGTFTAYDSSGKIQHRFTYSGIGKYHETDYYPEGQLMMEGNVENWKKAGDWIASYPSGKLKAKATFDSGRQVMALFYNEDGSPDNSPKIFFREADFPDGSNGWLKFIRKNLRYPDKAVQGNFQGTVVIQFKVSKDGTTSDFSVLQSANIYLDNEALRVIKASGDWLPAIFAGTPADLYITQHVVFKLDTQESPDTTKETIYTRVEIESAFPGGQGAWLRFLDKNLRYPRIARSKGIQGTVVVDFIVNKEGRVSYIHATTGPEELRKEAERLIGISSLWTPAIQDGRQVWSHKQLPIEFKLDQ